MVATIEKSVRSKIQTTASNLLHVADFYCHSHKIIVEVDGPIHDSKENQFSDLLRTLGFNQFNIEVMRFTNEEVLNNIEDVVLRIKEKLKVR